MKPQLLAKIAFGLLGTGLSVLVVGITLTDGETGDWIWGPKPPKPEPFRWTDANRWEK